MRLGAEWEAVMFFYRHAGFSYDPETESMEQGHIKSAAVLMRAERDARSLGIRFRWADDWGISSHVEEYGETYAREPATCQVCIALAPDYEVLATLGCIDDADDDYRRVIEAELAIEALAQQHG